ncbi:MAG TPA: peptidylprolyl isomerase [Dokdonella sp.]
MKSLLAGFALALLVAAAPGRAPAQSAAPVEPLDRIVAVVDEDVVLQSELDRDVNRVTAQYANSPQQLPPRDVLEKQVLDRLILQKLQVARADSTGVKVADAEVDQAVERIAQQNKMDVSQLRAAIQQQGLDYDQFRKSVRDQLVVNQLRQRVAQSRVQVSDAEIDSLIKNGSVRRDQMHLGYIVISVPDGATPDQVDTMRAKADEAKKQIDGGMDFGAAAIRYSSAENALQGGDLGWRPRQELPPAFVDIADKLQDGGVSEPARGPNGFYIIKRYGVRDAGAQMVTEYHARHIVIKTNELVSSEQAEKKAEQIREQLVAGADFVELAKKESQDEQTARLGGDLGWFPLNGYGTGVAEAVKDLKPGEVSKPFRSNLGWHVLQLVDTRSTDKSGELQRDEAKSILFQRKAEDEYESFLRQIRSEAYVDIRLPAASGDAGATNSGS